MDLRKQAARQAALQRLYASTGEVQNPRARSPPKPQPPSLGSSALVGAKQGKESTRNDALEPLRLPSVSGYSPRTPNGRKARALASPVVRSVVVEECEAEADPAVALAEAPPRRTPPLPPPAAAAAEAEAIASMSRGLSNFRSITELESFLNNNNVPTHDWGDLYGSSRLEQLWAEMQDGRSRLTYDPELALKRNSGALRTVSIVRIKLWSRFPLPGEVEGHPGSVRSAPDGRPPLVLIERRRRDEDKPDHAVKSRAQYLTKQVQFRKGEKAWSTMMRALSEELFGGGPIPFQLDVLGFERPREELIIKASNAKVSYPGLITQYEINTVEIAMPGYFESTMRGMLPSRDGTSQFFTTRDAVKRGVLHEWSWETHSEAERLVQAARGRILDRSKLRAPVISGETVSWFDRCTLGMFGSTVQAKILAERKRQFERLRKLEQSSRVRIMGGAIRGATPGLTHGGFSLRQAGSGFSKALRPHKRGYFMECSEDVARERLEDWLRECGIDVSRFGMNQFKTVSQLLKEVRRGDSTLELDAGGTNLLRKISVAKAAIRPPRDSFGDEEGEGELLLVETLQLTKVEGKNGKPVS